MDVSDSWR